MAIQRNQRIVPGRATLAAAGALAVVVASCDYDPGHANLPWRLSLKNRTVLDDAGLGSSEAQVTGALTTLFGTAENPRHLITTNMYDAEEDPNLAGDIELTDEQLDAIVEDNRLRRFQGRHRLAHPSHRHRSAVLRAVPSSAVPSSRPLLRQDDPQRG